MAEPKGVFDPHRPPSPDTIDDCVHCGFCLPACPTYTLWGQEMDSPRGRIHLMKLASQGEIALDDLVSHIDPCLGCMACVTACPSGVAYDELIEDTRAQIERNYTRPRADRWFRAGLFALFPYPRRLRLAAAFAWAYRRLRLDRLARRSGVLDRVPARLQALEALTPSPSLAELTTRLPTRVAAQGTPRLRVGLLTGCVQSVFFSDVNQATARVLAADGCDVVIPREQACCGALSLHTGRETEAAARAKALIAAFEESDVDRVVVNAAGCGSSMKDYGRLLADDPDWSNRAAAFAERVVDVTELLDELGPRAPRHPLPCRVVYQDACHLAHAQGVWDAPRRLLDGIPGLERSEIADAELCCGSAGVYNLVEPEPAAELGRRKAGNIEAADPDVVVTANPGCSLQLRRHLTGDVPVRHPVQLLDAAIRGVDVASLGDGGLPRSQPRS